MIYELRIGAVADSNTEDIGGFRGLTEKFDYLAEVLSYFGDGRERFRLNSSAKRAFP
jgi:hypothetical protein